MQQLHINKKYFKTYFILGTLFAGMIIALIYYDQTSLIKSRQKISINKSLIDSSNNKLNNNEHNIEQDRVKKPDEVEHTNEGEAKILDDDREILLLCLNQLIINLASDRSYQEQLQQLENIDLPGQIQSVIVELTKYNNQYLLDIKPYRQRIFPQESSFFERFIKIEKVTADESDQKISKMKILKHLHIAIDSLFLKKIH
jgi:hypothetical protein